MDTLTKEQVDTARIELFDKMADIMTRENPGLIVAVDMSDMQKCAIQIVAAKVSKTQIVMAFLAALEHFEIKPEELLVIAAMQGKIKVPQI